MPDNPEVPVRERTLREQDAKLTELIDDLVAAASGNTADDVDSIVDDLHEYIAEIRTTAPAAGMARMLFGGKAWWCVARVYRHAKGEITDEEITDPTSRPGIIALCEEAFAELNRAALAGEQGEDVDRSEPTDEAACANCGKPRREHRFGYSAFACKFRFAPLAEQQPCICRKLRRVTCLVCWQCRSWTYTEDFYALGTACETCGDDGLLALPIMFAEQQPGTTGPEVRDDLRDRIVGVLSNWAYRMETDYDDAPAAHVVADAVMREVGRATADDLLTREGGEDTK